jgi:ComF family protein
MLSLLARLPWPASCEVCNRWPSAAICSHCLDRYAALQPRCPGCALPMAPGLPLCVRCREGPPRALDRCVARVSYSYPWADAVARLKFQGQPAWAAEMARLMLQDPVAHTLLDECDLVTPIPLPLDRLLERGYNQAWELVRHLRRQAGPFDALHDLLLRAATDHTQHSLTRGERLTHAGQVLAVNPSHADALAGKKVLLVDDVMTTGATLNSAAALLRQAGARAVYGWVFARTPAPGT